MTEVTEHLPVEGLDREVPLLLNRPRDARALYLLGHGAGAGMRHAFIESVVQALAARRLATLRYEFPYMADGRRRPDPRAVLLATVRSAARRAGDLADGLPVIAGGKSMGGRMTSLAAAERALPNVRGLAFIGFPLHPRGRPDTARADHLSDIGLPMLFLQGTRDRLADLDLLEPVCESLGPTATLHIVDGADHSFGVLKRSARTSEDVVTELADAIAAWSAGL